jgi:hypothetical protein
MVRSVPVTSISDPEPPGPRGIVEVVRQHTSRTPTTGRDGRTGSGPGGSASVDLVQPLGEITGIAGEDVGVAEEQLAGVAQVLVLGRGDQPFVRVRCSCWRSSS